MLSPLVRMEMPEKLLALVTGGRRVRLELSESVLLQGRGSRHFMSLSVLLWRLLDARLELSRLPLRGDGLGEGVGVASGGWVLAEREEGVRASWVHCGTYKKTGNKNKRKRLLWAGFRLGHSPQMHVSLPSWKHQNKTQATEHQTISSHKSRRHGYTHAHTHTCNLHT